MTNLKVCRCAPTLLCLAALLALAPFGATLRAQDPDEGEPDETTTPEVKDPKVVEIEVLKAIAEAQAAIAESRARIIKAALPGEVEPLEGSVETEGEPIEAVILTYRAMQKVARTFRCKLAMLSKSQPQPKPCKDADSKDVDCQDSCTSVTEKELFIHSATEVDAILRYQGVTQRLQFLQKRLESLSLEFDKLGDSPAPPDDARMKGFFSGVPLILSGLLGSSLDILSLFRTDIEIKNTPASIEEDSLVAALLSESICGWKVYYPAQVPPSLLTLESALVDLLTTIDTMAIELRGKISKKREPLDKAVKAAEDEKKKAADAHAAELKKLEDELKAAQAGGDQTAIDLAKKAIEDAKARFKTEVAELDTKIKNAKDALESYDDTTAPVKATLDLYDVSKNQLLQPDEATGKIPFDSLIRAEKLYTAMKPNGYLLSLRVVEASGSEMKKKNLWTPEAPIFHKGGVVASFILYEPGGAIAGSGLAADGGNWKRADLSGKSKASN